MAFLKNYAATFFLLLFFMGSHGQSPLMDVTLKPLRGPLVSFATLTAKDSIVLVCFWSTASDQSINELNAINTHWVNWQSRTPFRMLAVAIEEGKGSGRVRAMANSSGWLFDVFEDINDEFRQATGVKKIPLALIIMKGKVIYQQAGFESGSENYLIEKIKELNSK